MGLPGKAVQAVLSVPSRVFEVAVTVAVATLLIVTRGAVRN